MKTRSMVHCAVVRRNCSIYNETSILPASFSDLEDRKSRWLRSRGLVDESDEVQILRSTEIHNLYTYLRRIGQIILDLNDSVDSDLE